MPGSSRIFCTSVDFPEPDGPETIKHQRSKLLFVPRSFDVLHLLAQFFDLRFYFQRQAGDGQRFTFDARRLRKHGVGFAMHFLQQKIEFLAEFAGTIEQLGELLEVAAQAI